MKTTLIPSFLESKIGQQADDILRKCVHCGFCNATCPTYQITGDELDGPRGRIYLIKQILEGNQPTEKTQLHLDRCLTCRNCETTCPSGVQYSHLLDTGRALTEKAFKRPLTQRLFRTVLRRFLLSPLFYPAIFSGRLMRPFMPAGIKQLIPNKNPIPTISRKTYNKKVLLIEGCVQKSLQPSIDASAINVFNHLAIETVKIQSSGCCGALNHHLSAEDAALTQIKINIDTWLPLLESDEVIAITMTATGCGVMIRDYQHVLQNDVQYAEKAKRISDAYLDPIEIVQAHNNQTIKSSVKKRVAFHPPCTLQHGQKITGQVESLLTSIGHELVTFDDSHLCCGSAGTYSITQKKLSQQLLKNKLHHIQDKQPDIIVTANIGCQTHLQSGTKIPIRHWLELLS